MRFDWKEVGAQLAKLGLPVLGLQLGGPLGATIGAEIASRIGAREPTPEVVMQAIQSADPETLIKLREIEVEMAQVNTAHDQAILRMQIEDAQNARDNASDDQMRRILAPFMMASPLVFAGYVIWASPPEPVFSVAMLVIGYTIASAEKVGNFLFGSSLGSKKKQQELNQIVTSQQAEATRKAGA